MRSVFFISCKLGSMLDVFQESMNCTYGFFIIFTDNHSVEIMSTFANYWNYVVLCANDKRTFPLNVITV